ncbi:uncharacterized protein LOC118204839 [Stegodyphus dumicola]|uniref:uncharacterized protein LOC118204839 n=1 Tax=Stegodyphus dumicola TaxID=202533 RepID=UPI0015A85042|nr:uncharacterized protein LOC118204839 [Stegodyphus dumicola]
MIHVLVLLGLLGAVLCDECDPGFADTCFTSVTEDLRYMLDLKKMTTVNITKAAVHELCLALEDSLNCTSDIIDSDCTKDNGKETFDSWLRALKGAYNYVCQGDHGNIRGKSKTTAL